MALTMTAIHEMLAPGAKALGYELVAVELGGGDTSVLCCYIDSENGIGVDDCAKASRQFSAILDVEDPISSKYNLEVSSPGLDRPLVTLEHFEQAIDKKIKVKLAMPLNGRKRFTGIVVEINKEVGNESVLLNVDNEEFELMVADMDRARLVPDYSVLPSID
ncbi:MAG: ribosome maturation factor RimP [Arenicella sp.]